MLNSSQRSSFIYSVFNTLVGIDNYRYYFSVHKIVKANHEDCCFIHTLYQAQSAVCVCVSALKCKPGSIYTSE